MPDANGLLTVQDNEKIQKWWNMHWVAPVICPVCKTSEWSVADHVVNIPRYALDSNAASTATYPHIIVGCKKCGHAMFFNAVVIGIAPAWGAIQPPQVMGGIFGSLAPASPLSPPVFPPFKSG